MLSALSLASTSFAPATVAAPRAAVQVRMDAMSMPEEPPAPPPLPKIKTMMVGDKTLAGDMGFDPLQLADNSEKLAFYREAEIKHGRVAMLASVGFLFQEHYTFTGIDSPSYVSFEQPGLAGGLWLGLAVMLGNVEGKSVESFMPLDGGIVAEQNESRLFRIKEDHAPGDLGFDPLGLKPTNAADLKSMATKEINNGRLAMVGIAGMVAQELVSGMKI